MSSKREDGVDNETESGVVKPTSKKYPFQTVKRSSTNNSEINKPVTEDLKNEQSESKLNEKESLAEISLAQIVHEAPKIGGNLAEMVSERHDQNSKDTWNKKDAHVESQEANSPSEQPAEAVITENGIELEVVEVSEKKGTRKKIRRKDLTEKELNEICGERDGKKGGNYTKTRTPGVDPRFQQQNQTLRCFVMYTDFYRCENILGEGELACQWFKDVFTSICPLDWIRRWDEAREEGRLGWTKGRTQGKFPGDRYGS